MKEDNQITFNSEQEFVAYSLPGENDYVYQELLNYSISKEDLLNCDFVIAPFDNKMHHTYFLKLSDPIINHEFSCIPQDSSSEIGTSELDYFNAFEKCKEIIKSGDINKIVLSKIKVVETHPLDVYNIFSSLIEAYPNGFVYLINMKKLGCWIGVSPELLITANSNKYETAAIAGTQRANQPIDEVVWTSKEKKEHEIIEAYLKSSFNDSDINYNKSAKYTYKAGAMYHIKSDFIFDSGSELDDILNLIHPGPAISGSDVRKAKSIIRDVESHDRKLYAGYLGPIQNKNKLEFYVNLRCMQIFNNQFCLYLGGGLVDGSKVEDEWQETELKASTLLKIIES